MSLDRDAPKLAALPTCPTAKSYLYEKCTCVRVGALYKLLYMRMGVAAARHQSAVFYEERDRPTGRRELRPIKYLLSFFDMNCPAAVNVLFVIIIHRYISTYVHFISRW